MATTKMMVLSNPVPGREDEYNDWYTNRHIPDVVACPGLVSGQRFKIEGDDRWKYAAIYEIEGDVAAAQAGMMARANTPAMPISDSLDAAGALMITLSPIMKPHTK